MECVFKVVVVILTIVLLVAAANYVVQPFQIVSAVQILHACLALQTILYQAEPALYHVQMVLS